MQSCFSRLGAWAARPDPARSTAAGPAGERLRSWRWLWATW